MPVSLSDFKIYIGNVTHTLKDDDITRHLAAATVWVSRKSNIPAADFDVQLIQDKPTREQDLMFDNITISSVCDFDSGEDISYETNSINSKIRTEAEYRYLVNYSCTAVSNSVLNDAILNYALVLYSGQTDIDAEQRIVRDLQVIQNEIY